MCVQVFNTEASKFTKTFKCNKGEGNIVGICNYSNNLIVAKQSGDIIQLSSNENEEECCIINNGPGLHKMRQVDKEKKLIATGGVENPLKLFDLEKRKEIFVAKNVKNDFLGLKVPIWVSDIGFISESNVVTASKYGHVQLYDIRAQRRPVIRVEMKSEALGSLTVHPSKMQVIVGSGKGRMNLIDLRKEGKILNTYKGPVGSVTGIAINKDGDNVISVSFDRNLRIHDINTKSLLKKQYLSTRLTSLLIRSELAFSNT
ncbi:WD repeat-containing protein 74 isoform X2 [Leptopilina boulardi]|uniref:WD repeat-containing protein 74 isoform X2 n=1 Tax=Leptopilina boulardi TaxID=63433 RepID=UPI0021F65610|nr:WD repeat-containing protein 74 isoform X2 [Leptopilina boulardi]